MRKGAVFINITLQIARPEDARQIWEMQVRAFEPLLLKYRDYDTNPAAETLDRVLSRVTAESSVCYWIIEDGVKCGMLRVRDLKDGVYRVGPLFVEAASRGRGVAQAAMRQAEKLYPRAVKWQLDTIAEEEGNCRLYEKLGYRRCGSPRRINERMTLVDYEKDGNEGAGN